ncbi:hypothetical protein BJV74DRAFT_965596 [Russula compacta]|nr:hypothetical protein BJV74DRAFT_965596 [Russula compacta]
MHRLARSLATAAGCSSKTTSAARLATATSQRSSAVLNLRPWLPRRTIHVRVPLPYKVEDGMGDFLSPAALKVIAEDYQQGLLDRLNEQIKGTNFENMSVAQIVISTAPHESQTLAFNYASLALNNSFFLHHLKPPTGTSPNHEAALNDRLTNTEIQTLGGVIARQMGSLQDLKTYVSAAATGMLPSSGFVWLATDALGQLAVIATYGAGTLLVAERRQTLAPDRNPEFGGVYVPAENPAAPSTSTSTSASPPPTSSSSPASSRRMSSPPLSSDIPPGAVRALSTSACVRSSSNGVARPANVWSDAPPGTGNGNRTGSMLGAPDEPPSLDTIGHTLYPLFCVSVHEHAWMAAGYGVWGKETYLERFWTCLDWAAVREAYARYALTSLRKYQY